MNTKIITLSSALLLLSVTMGKAAELNCVKGSTLSGDAAKTECEAMGYTMTWVDCGEGTIVYCPLNQIRVFCTPKSPLPILYGDGTISNYIIEGKKPVGIIFDEKNKLAVALTYVKKDGTPGEEEMEWSTETIDTPLTNCSDDEEDIITTCSPDGQANTAAILKVTTGSYPAAQAVNKYEPEGCSAAFCKKGKWFLGSVKELLEAWYKYRKINNAITVLKRASIPDIKGEYLDYYNYLGWTSNERREGNAYCITFLNNIYSYESKSRKRLVRPIVKY